MSANQTILGIDPGYDRLGWAVGTVQGNNWRDIHHGVIQTDSKQTITKRYQTISEELTQLIKKHRPTVAVIESLFFFKNQTTVMKVSEARGVIISACLANKLTIEEFTPLQIKQAVTGYGRADKKAVEKMMRIQLNLKNEKIIDDAIDALAIMLTYKVQNKLLDPKTLA